jgi:hypothetical protein
MSNLIEAALGLLGSFHDEVSSWTNQGLLTSIEGHIAQIENAAQEDVRAGETAVKSVLADLYGAFHGHPAAPAAPAPSEPAPVAAPTPAPVAPAPVPAAPVAAPVAADPTPAPTTTEASSAPSSTPSASTDTAAPASPSA